MGRKTILAGLMVACLAATCDAPANRTGVAAQNTTPPPPRRFEPAATPLPDDAPEVRLRAALRSGEPPANLALAVRLLGESPSFETAARLHWLAADAAEAAGDPGAARRHLEAIAGGRHPLARWASLRVAELLLEERPAAAARVAATLVDDWAGRDGARIVEATALARAGQNGEAVPRLRQLVEETPGERGAARAGMPLAAILAQSEAVADREEALSLYRRIATRAPAARVGHDAAERAARVLATLPEERREALRDIPIDDLFARARAFYVSLRHEEAEEAYAELAGRLSEDAGQRCLARLMEGKAILRRRDRRRGAAHMKSVAEDCEDPDVRARARYSAGQAHQQRGERSEAIAQYEALQEEAPGHRLADDALLRAALATGDVGDAEAMRTMLAAFPERYPDGDMRGEARFALAWAERRAAQAAAPSEARVGAPEAGDGTELRGADGDGEEGEETAPVSTHLRAALAQLDASLEEGPGEDAEDIHGRAAYWRARTLRDLGRTTEAVEAWTGLVRAWPLSYYARQSLARLDEVERPRADALRAEMRGDGEVAEPLDFPWRTELDSTDFQSALELLRVGDVDRALRDLEHLGFTAEEADAETLWLVAATLHAAGAHPEASRLVRRRLGELRGTAPIGPARARWRIAYPLAFQPLIEEAASAEGVPASFVRAIAREESAFEPGAVSVAHAYGLVQLMGPTARRFGDQIDLPSTPSDLRRPEINVRIGARFMAFLWSRFEDNPAVVPAAYNAGEHAVDRWIRSRPDQPLDEWIEEIPYDETRRYTRRVLQTHGIYAWLDEGDLPPLERALPAR